MNRKNVAALSVVAAALVAWLFAISLGIFVASVFASCTATGAAI